jgi:hypothetical protein
MTTRKRFTNKEIKMLLKIKWWDKEKVFLKMG